MHRRIVFWLATCWTLAFCASAEAPKRHITEKDLFDFQWIGDPQLSPNGDRLAFVKVTVNPKRDGYESSLWMANLRERSQPVQLTNGPFDAAPRWSPDGGALAFTRAIEREGKPAPAQLYMLSFAGGEPHVLTSLGRGAGNPLFSPDGKHLLFTSSTAPEDTAKHAEHESDVRVIAHAMYRMNGEGYIDFKHPAHLWVIDVPAPGAMPVPPVQLTHGRFSEGDAAWSPDSSDVYFLTNKKDEPYYELPQNELDRIRVQGGTPERVLQFPFRASELAVSPDGKAAAVHGSAKDGELSYSQPDLWTVALTPGARPRNLTIKYDYDMGDGVGGDNRAPRAPGAQAPLWSANGETVYDLSGKEGSANLVAVDIKSGAVKEISRGKQAVQLVAQSRDRAHFAGLISTPVSVGDLYTMTVDGAQHQVTDINQKLFSQLELTQPEEIWIKSFDGRRIQVWVQKPPDFDAAKKYPVILNIHGGPHSAYGWVFDHEFQWMAAQGYVVVYPNPRGSTTYGQEFGNIIQHKYPGDDYRDLMAAVDEVVKRGYGDPERLGVTGGSGGGVLTDWTVTRTRRFKAAVSQRDISDWTSWWYTDDFLLFQPTWFKGAPFDVPGDFSSRSAITYVKKIQTPMMFILGDADYRTPPTSGGEQLFRALKYMKQPTVMVRFPGESHELSRSGQPWHRVERLEHIVGWFDKYLKGINKPEYDIVPGVVPQPAPHEYQEGNPTVQ